MHYIATDHVPGFPETRMYLVSEEKFLEILKDGQKLSSLTDEDMVSESWHEAKPGHHKIIANFHQGFPRLSDIRFQLLSNFLLDVGSLIKDFKLELIPKEDQVKYLYGILSIHTILQKLNEECGILWSSKNQDNLLLILTKDQKADFSEFLDWLPKLPIKVRSEIRLPTIANIVESLDSGELPIIIKLKRNKITIHVSPENQNS